MTQSSLYTADLATKLMMAEQLLYIVDKEAQLRLIRPNYAQQLLFASWSHQMLLLKSRQLGISTGILALFFIEAQIIPGLVVAIVSHEDYATRRLLDKVDLFHKHLPEQMKSKMFHNSDNEKAFGNGSTIYIGTAGQRAFGRGDTIHRVLVSEEAHYSDAEKLLSGLREAVPMSGYIVRESTPLGDTGYFYNSVQECIEGKSDYKLVPFYWWYGQEYRIPRGSELVLEQDRGALEYTPKELELVLEKGLDEEQVRWKRWKIRSMRSEKVGSESLFPQEYIEDLESCWLGPADKVFSDVEDQLQSLSLRARDPIKTEGILEIWKEPEPGARYIFWVDPAGGESPTENDPHDGVVLKLGPWGLEHVASVCSRMEQKPFAYKVAEIGTKYNLALLVVERNGVGRGVLNYLVNDIGYRNLYPERAANGELTGKWGWNTDHWNKAGMVGNTLTALKSNSVTTYDKKLIRQLRALINKDGKIQAKKPAHDDRAMAFMGAITASPSHTGGVELASGDFVTFPGRR
uniref:Putative terminase n=1 Tax=viral metagenome TaxID=1070528 RepID=A0A6M3JE62_9ZZZZ